MFNINDKVVYVGPPASLAQSGKCSNAEYSFPDGRIEKGRVYCVSGVTSQRWGCESKSLPSIFITGNRLIFSATGQEVPRPAFFFRLVSEVQAENRAKRKDQKPAKP